jgi:hypothetical protein
MLLNLKDLGFVLRTHVHNHQRSDQDGGKQSPVTAPRSTYSPSLPTGIRFYPDAAKIAPALPGLQTDSFLRAESDG